MVESNVALRDEYNDNRPLSTGPTDSVYGVSVTPTVSFSTASNISKSLISAKLQATRYSEESVPNTDIQILSIDHINKGRRNRVSVTGEYRRDTTFATLTDLEIDGLEDEEDDEDADLADSDIGLTNVKVRRINSFIRPGWRYRLSPTYSIDLSYNYTQRRYSNDANTGLVEFDQGRFKVGLRKVFDQKNSMSYSVSQTKFESDLNEDSTNNEINLGYRHKYSSVSSVALIAGYRRTESDTSESTTGSTAGINYNSRGEISTWDVSLRRRVRGSGIGELIQQDQLDLEYRNKFTELMSFRLRSTLFQTESLGQDNSTDRRYISIEPLLSYTVSRNFSFLVSYRHREQKYDADTETAKSDAIGFEIFYSFSPVRGSI